MILRKARVSDQGILKVLSFTPLAVWHFVKRSENLRTYPKNI